MKLLDLVVPRGDLGDLSLVGRLGLIEKCHRFVLHPLGIGNGFVPDALCLIDEHLRFGRRRCTCIVHLCLCLGDQILDPLAGTLVSVGHRGVRGLLGHDEHLLDALLGVGDDRCGLLSGFVDTCLGGKNLGLRLLTDRVSRSLGVRNDLHRAFLDPPHGADRVDLDPLSAVGDLGLGDQRVDLFPHSVTFDAQVLDALLRLLDGLSHRRRFALSFLDDGCRLSRCVVDVLGQITR